MRVLFLHDRICTGGSERNTIDLMTALARIGVEPHICLSGRGSRGPLAEELERSRIPIHRLEGARTYDPRMLGRFARLLLRERFDVLHLEDPYPAPLAAVARHLFSIPVVMTRHVQMDDRATRWSALRARWLNLAMRLASDRVIMLAASLREGFASQSGIKPKQMVVVPNGIQLWADARGRRAELRRRFGWASGEKVILIVAVLRGGKGHEDLFAAMPRVLGPIPEATVKVVGDGSERARIEALAQPLGDKVRFLGERRDVAELMAAADLLVLPSWSEAFPTVLLEAAMSGLPAVATDVGGSAEIIAHGETGLIVPACDPEQLAGAIAAILADVDRAGRMSSAARARAERLFTIERQAATTRAVYQDLIESGHASMASVTTPLSTSE